MAKNVANSAKNFCLIYFSFCDPFFLSKISHLISFLFFCIPPYFLLSLPSFLGNCFWFLSTDEHPTSFFLVVVLVHFVSLSKCSSATLCCICGVVTAVGHYRIIIAIAWKFYSIGFDC